MEPTTAAAQRNPTAIMVLVLALVAIGLGGYVAGAWLNHSPATGAAPALPAPVLLVVIACLGAVLALARRQRRAPDQPGVRDPLTGLYSQGFAGEFIPGLIAQDERCGRSELALVRIAVVRIDEVRHRYGEAAAARVLGSIGRHIRSQTRGGDIPAVADERGFAIYLRCAEIDQATAFCRRLTTLLHSDQLDWQGDVIKVSAHMGVAIRRLGEPLDDLNRRALHKLAIAQASDAGQIVA